MKADIKLTLIYVTIGVIAAGVTAYFLYQDRTNLWRENARSTFAEVLREELQKRSMKDVFYTSWGNANSFVHEDSVRNDSLQEVEITSEDGRLILPYVDSLYISKRKYQTACNFRLKIVNFVDGDCSTCLAKIAFWKKFISEVNSLGYKEIPIIMYASSSLEGNLREYMDTY